MQIAASIPRPVRRFLPTGSLRGKPVLLAVLVLAALVGAGVVVYLRVLAPATPAPVGQIVPVRRDNVAATVSATGSVVATKQAKLVFAASGRIKEILVSVGDQVTAGQPLARLVSDATQVKLDTAKSQLTTARLKLQQTTENSTPEELAAAKAAYDAAVAKLSDLQAGPTAADLQAAQSAVIQARASVDETTGKLQTLLGGATSTDRASAEASLVSAQNGLAAAQAKLEQLQAGPTEAEAASAQATMDEANASQRSAQAKLDQLKAGATQADLASAQAAFDQAQGNLNSAKAKLDQAKATSFLSPEVIQAQSSLAAAESKLHTSHQSLDQLTAQLQQANANLAGQQSSLSSSIKSADQTCSKLGSSSAECASARSKIDTMQPQILQAEQQVKLLTGSGSWSQLGVQKDVLAAQAAYDAAAANLKQTSASHSVAVELITAQSTYDSALSQLTSTRAKLDQTRAGATNADLIAAQSAVDQATASVASAQAKLNQTLQGATDADMVAAQTAAVTARANLESAQTKWDNLGVVTPQDLQSARAAQASAQAALLTAQAKLAQVQGGPTQPDLDAAKSSVAGAQATLSTKSGNVRSSDVALQQEAVHQAELAVQQAQIDLDNNTLVAPFDGIVASVAGNAGENAPSGNNGFVNLVDPREVRVDVTVDETDVAKMAVGKGANITFDALPGRTFRGKVISISPNGSLSQGVVTYPVSLNIDTRNQVLNAGLTASATITVDERNDVLVVPNRAVRRLGPAVQAVDVLGADGKPAPRPVKTGLQNDQQVEITDGLQEGDQVVIQATTTRSLNVPGVPGGARPGPQPVVVTR